MTEALSASINRSVRRRNRLHKAMQGYLFASPWIIGFLLFSGGPIVASMVLSLTDYDVMSPINWVGLANYSYLFLEDVYFWKSLGNSAYYTFISVPVRMLVALAIALLMNQKLRGIKAFRVMFYLPSIASGVAVSLLWLWLLDPSIGLINITLARIGIRGPLWLQSPAWSKPAIILMSLWNVGTIWVIYLAGLQGIDKQLLEAAEIDGAGKIRKFFHITIPMLSPALFFTFITGVIYSFQVFTQALVMTEGGPRNSTLFYVFQLYMMGFRQLEMGTASAMAWILFLIILGITLLQFKLASRWVYYEGNLKRW